MSPKGRRHFQRNQALESRLNFEVDGSALHINFTIINNEDSHTGHSLTNGLFSPETEDTWRIKSKFNGYRMKVPEWKTL